MRHVVTLLVGAAAGAAAVVVLRGRGGPLTPPVEAVTAGPTGGRGRVAVDVSGAPADPV